MRNYMKIPLNYIHLEDFLGRRLWTGQGYALQSLSSIVYRNRVAASLENPYKHPEPHSR